MRIQRRYAKMDRTAAMAAHSKVTHSKVTGKCCIGSVRLATQIAVLITTTKIATPPK